MQDIFIFQECKVGYLYYTMTQNLGITHTVYQYNSKTFLSTIFSYMLKNIFFKILSGVWIQITLFESGVWIHTPFSRFPTVNYEILLQ